ncbi:MAG: HAMP domain-containing protein [Magnetococcales bacterium]|nr:HAMP domain-containing protein [Magnetococcales bacterium]
MSLQWRLSILVSLIITLQVILTMVIQETVVTPRFTSLEQKEAAKNLDRVIEAIHREGNHVSLLATDWAAWEDAYEFVHNPTQAFIASNLSPELFAGIHANLIYFYDLQGTLVWGKYYDPKKKEFVPWPDLPTRIDDSLRSLITHKSESDAHVALFMSSTGPMLLAARPIVHTGFVGPIRGTLMMARQLDERLVEELIHQTHVPFQVFAADRDGHFAETERPIVKHLMAGNPSLWRDEGEDRRIGHALLRDFHGRPGILIRAETTREISHEGHAAYWSTLVSNLIQGMVMLALLLTALHRLVIRPLIHLNAQISTVATQGDLTQRTNLDRNDEIGTLARQFDRLITNLADIVGKIHLHAHTLETSVKALESSKETLEKDAQASQTLAVETIAAYRILEADMETIRQAVTITNQEVAGMTTATGGLGANLENITRATSQAGLQIDAMETSARAITGHIDGVRDNLDQVEGSIQSISVAITDLAESLAEVRNQSGATARESEQARRHADTANEVTQRLSHSATSIGQVVEVINNIAEQTNMLALNASIEAAGAGSAGAGFSVVADEVKVLAQKTAQATEMISERIQDIQDISRDNGRAFSAVTTSIDRIHRGNQTIAIAVKLQSDRLDDISRAIGGVTQASGAVLDRVGELGNAALDVTRSVAQVVQDTREIARSVDEASNEAKRLVEQSGTMDKTARQMHESTLRGTETTTLAHQRLDAIIRQIHLLTGMIHRMAHLVATTATPGHHLLEAAQTLDIGPAPFDVGSIKSRILELSAPVEQQPGPETDPPAPTHHFEAFDRDVAQILLETCTHAGLPREPFVEAFAELKNILHNPGEDTDDSSARIQARIFSLIDALYLHCLGLSRK